MKVLVTGGTGFLGQSLVRRLSAAGEMVRVLVRPSSRKGAADLSGAEPVIGDLGDASSLERALDGVEAVCHCAARVEARGSWSDFEAVNVRGTERLLEAAGGEGITRFLHVSSLGVYGLHGQETVTEGSPFDDHPGERGHYTRSKIEAEQAVWTYSREHGLPITVIRPGILYGPGRPPVVARLVVPVGPKLRIVIARPDQRLPLAYVDNVAEAIHLALRSKQAIGRDYNVVDSEAILQGEYLTLLRKVGLSQARIIRLPPTLLYPLVSSCEHVCRWMGIAPPLSSHQFERASASVRYDTSRAREELGWSPQVGLVEGLRTLRGAGGPTRSLQAERG